MLALTSKWRFGSEVVEPEREGWNDEETGLGYLGLDLDCFCLVAVSAKKLRTWLPSMGVSRH